MFNFFTNCHNSLMRTNVTDDFIKNLQSKTIFDSSCSEPYYKLFYRNIFYFCQNICCLTRLNFKQMKSDREFVQRIVKVNNVDQLELKLKKNRNLEQYVEILHENLIIKEMEEKTNKVIDMFDNNFIAYAITQYTAGNCWFNVKLSHNLKLNDDEQLTLKHINLATSLVEPLSVKLTLFHGFEKYVNYEINNNVVNVKGIISKTLSLNIAQRFASGTNNLQQEFLIINYSEGSRHIKQSIRPFDEEFEFLSHSNESFEIVRICKYFDNFRLLTFYVCVPLSKQIKN